jgi:chemotaxis protein MotB
MFETGSAKPTAAAMKLVEAIAAALKSRKGRIVIRGHTDSRPYRNKFYDNWQLSTARAHFARYMLVRGGLDEKRLHKVEGVADREPRNREDPQAAENRRIEILIESETP